MKKKIEKSTWIKISIICVIVVAILLVDLLTKYLLDASLTYGQSYSIIPGLFNFVFTYNYGAGFGILDGKSAFLIAISLLFLAIFTWYFCKEKEKTWLLCIAYSFLVGGCLGNLFDRIFFGYVRDFIQFDFWQSFPIFNFADAFLTIGVVLFVIYVIVYFVAEYRSSKSSAVKIEVPENEKTEKPAKTDNKSAKKGEKKHKNSDKNKNEDKEDG